MDNTTQHFVIEKLLDELRAIRQALAALHCDVQKQIDAVQKANEAQVERDKSPSVLRAELQIPPAIEAKNEAAERKKQHREYFKILVEILTLFAVGAYAFVSYRTLQEIKRTGTDTHDLAVQAEKQAAKTGDIAGAADSFSKSADSINRQTQSAVAEFHRLADAASGSLKSTQDSFRDDQRAWIGVGDFIISQYYPNPLKVEVTFVNSGKTPALRIESANQIFFAPKQVPQPPPEIEKQLIYRRTGAIPPQGKRTLSVTESDLTLDLLGRSLHDWLASNHGLLEAKSSFLYADGEIRYEDVYGRRHRTTWCLWMYDPNTHSLGVCGQGNDMN